VFNKVTVAGAASYPEGSIKFNVPKDKLVSKYFKPTGNEYKNYFYTKNEYNESTSKPTNNVKEAKAEFYKDFIKKLIYSDSFSKKQADSYFTNKMQKYMEEYIFEGYDVCKHSVNYR